MLGIGSIVCNVRLRVLIILMYMYVCGDYQLMCVWSLGLCPLNRELCVECRIVGGECGGVF